MGYIVYQAQDAVNAVSAVRQNSPDIVVLDISLPAGDGFVVAERLQNLVGFAATPIIFVTASESPALRDAQGRNSELVGFLTKPSMHSGWLMPSSRRCLRKTIGSQRPRWYDGDGAGTSAPRCQQ